MMAEYLKETLRAANQAFDAGTAAAGSAGTHASTPKLATAIKALEAIANMNSDPNRASSEYRCQEAALCASNALTAIRGMK